MTNSEIVPRFVKYRLRDVLEGQVLLLAGANFSVVAKHRRDRLVHLDLQADDKASATLIGMPGARVRLREDTSAAPQ
jgi:hypothetical protein